jgi:hypothetical protein
MTMLYFDYPGAGFGRDGGSTPSATQNGQY